MRRQKMKIDLNNRLKLAILLIAGLLVLATGCDIEEKNSNIENKNPPIEEKNPTIIKIVPDFGVNTGNILVVIKGSKFTIGATIKLSRIGEPDITASGVTLNGKNEIWAYFNLSGAKTGKRDLTVTNPDGGSGSLIEGFNVLKPTMLYVASNHTSSVLVFHSADTYSGAVATDRTITYSKPNCFIQPSDVFIDSKKNLLYVSDWTANKVLVFSKADTVNGYTKPTRIISSDSRFDEIYSIFVDTLSNQLYISSFGSNSIYVIANASKTDGDIIPTRIMTGTSLNKPIGIFLDTTHNRLYVTNSGESNCFISVFNNVSALNGIVKADRIITSPELTPWLYDVFVDISRDILYAIVPNGKRVVIYQNASTIDGAATPNVVLYTDFYPDGIYLDSEKDILFTNDNKTSALGQSNILIYENASLLTSTSKPSRIITKLTSPVGMWGVRD